MNSLHMEGTPSNQGQGIKYLKREGIKNSMKFKEELSKVSNSKLVGTIGYV